MSKGSNTSLSAGRRCPLALWHAMIHLIWKMLGLQNRLGGPTTGHMLDIEHQEPSLNLVSWDHSFSGCCGARAGVMSRHRLKS